jgi:hypothetical protein
MSNIDRLLSNYSRKVRLPWCSDWLFSRWHTSFSVLNQLMRSVRLPLYHRDRRCQTALIGFVQSVYRRVNLCSFCKSRRKRVFWFGKQAEDFKSLL